MGLDFDNTYTLDPTFWQKIYDLAKASGHQIICVTWRFGTQKDKEDLKILPPDMSIVFAGGRSKIRMAKKAGYKIDVWVDNFPLSEYLMKRSWLGKLWNPLR